MLDLFQLLAIDYCTDLKPIISLVKAILGVIQFGIPVVLILLGTIDLGKAVMSSDDKEVKASQGRLIKRCIYAALVFFVVIIVRLIMNLVSDSTADATIENEKSSTSWIECWNKI